MADRLLIPGGSHRGKACAEVTATVQQPMTVSSVKLNKGTEIRAKVAENRARRLAIAEAMKREAGVTGHEVNREGFGGLAYIGTGRIKSPSGENMRQLYIVAHECGHIFLHNDGAGFKLPSHVMEMEAESYAHQAFREHGMNLARRFSDWGRRYVGEWIERDRAAGVSIDPRAEEYARGLRSPYAPLRAVPATWRLHRREAHLTSSEEGAKENEIFARRQQLVRQELLHLANARWTSATRKKSLMDHADDWLRFVWSHFLLATCVAAVSLIFIESFPFLPPITYVRESMLTMEALLACAGVGLSWTCLAAVFRTMVR